MNEIYEKSGIFHSSLFYVNVRYYFTNFNNLVIPFCLNG